MQTRSSNPARGFTRRTVLLGAVATALLTGISIAHGELKPSTVRLVVDYGDGVEMHYKAIAWRDGMTVLDVLAAAKKHARPLAYSQRGSGRGALITQIGGLANEGGGATDKNWMYTVNGKAPKLAPASKPCGPKTLSCGSFRNTSTIRNARQDRK